MRRAASGLARRRSPRRRRRLARDVAGARVRHAGLTRPAKPRRLPSRVAVAERSALGRCRSRCCLTRRSCGVDGEQDRGGQRAPERASSDRHRCSASPTGVQVCSHTNFSKKRSLRAVFSHASRRWGKSKPRTTSQGLTYNIGDESYSWKRDEPSPSHAKKKLSDGRRQNATTRRATALKGLLTKP